MDEGNVSLSINNASHLVTGMYVDGNSVKEVEISYKQVLEAAGFPFAFLEQKKRNIVTSKTEVNGVVTSIMKEEVTGRRFRCSRYGKRVEKTTRIRKKGSFKTNCTCYFQIKFISLEHSKVRGVVTKVKNQHNHAQLSSMVHSKVRKAQTEMKISRAEIISRVQKFLQVPLGPKQIEAALRGDFFMLKAAKLVESCVSSEKAFNVGCVITKIIDGHEILLVNGFSREIAGNTHAEECALLKLGHIKTNSSFESLRALPDCSMGSANGCIVYTTMEPCSLRTSGNRSCSSRLISAKVAKVVIGVAEPANFVTCNGIELLKNANIAVEFVQNEQVLALCRASNQHLSG